MVKACVSEVYDLSTQTGVGTVLKVHTPTGTNIKRHLIGHFLQYRRYRYVGAKVTLIPASTLPADPLQLSYEAGEPTIDPRDMVNPILWKHYHGESMRTDLLWEHGIQNYLNDTAANSELGENQPGSSVMGQFFNDGSGNAPFYPLALMDQSFHKAAVQRGFSTFVRPYAYNVAANFQISENMYGTSSTQSLSSPQYGPFPQIDFEVNNGANQGGVSGESLSRAIIRQTELESDLSGPIQLGYVSDSSTSLSAKSPGVMFTNKLTRLGWMDTMQYGFRVSGDPSPSNNVGSLGDTGVPGHSQSFFNALLPYVDMLYILMPPAYKTEFYFRLVIKHFFEFAGFRSAWGVGSYGFYAQNGVSPYPAAPPASVPLSLASVGANMAAMMEEISTGGPDSVTVENGTLIPAADGASSA